MVDAGVGDDDQAGFFEGSGDVVGEGPGGEAAGDGLCTGVGGEFEDGAVSVGTSGDDADVVGVLDGGDDACCKNELFPGVVFVEICSSYIYYIYTSLSRIEERDDGDTERSR